MIYIKYKKERCTGSHCFDADQSVLNPRGGSPPALLLHGKRPEGAPPGALLLLPAGGKGDAAGHHLGSLWADWDVRIVKVTTLYNSQFMEAL